jgi:chaperonin GroEL (HSP60 family)
LFISNIHLQLLFIDISKVQDDEVGDGTTSVVVLASELLRVCFIELIFMNIYSMIIGNGKFIFTKNSSSNYHQWMA